MRSRPKVTERLRAGAGALAALLLAGGLGFLGISGLAGTIYDGWRAKDWVKVRAELIRVDGTDASYAYTWEGRKLTSSRVGSLRFRGSSEVDDWDDRIADALATAYAEKMPVTAWVNPDEPSEAMLDREVRWMLILVLMPFSIGIAALGIWGFLAFGARAIGWDWRIEGRPLLRPPVRSALANWAVALGWNAVAIPIALLAIPDLYSRGEWLAVVLLAIFPLIGALILWSALATTLRALREAFFDTPRPT
jgi:hypothetical protein